MNVLTKWNLLSRFNQVRYHTSKIVDYSYQEFISKLPTYAGGDVYLELNDENGIAILSIDNPRSKNAITGSIAVKLNDIVEKLSKWNNGKAVILRGTNQQFCSGGDLKYFMNHLTTPELGGHMCRYMQDVMFRFKKLPFITVAVIQGKTLGGGSELAVACDFRLMQQNADIAFVQSKMGITTGFGGTTNLVNLLGRRGAMKLLMSAKSLKSDKAYELALVDEIFPDDADEVHWSINWLETNRLLASDPRLLQNIKKMTSFAESASHEDSFNYERNVFRKFWKGELHHQALSKNIKHR